MTLNPRQFFHGTSKVPSWKPEGITPHSSRKYGQTAFPHDTDPEYAYATDKDTAWTYAEKAWHNTGVGVPRVFRVSPRGPVEKDPSRDARGELRGNYEADIRSRHGFDVVGEEKMPENMGKPRDWR